MQESVDEILARQVRAHSNSYMKIVTKMDDGDLKPKTALALCDAYSSVDPQVARDLLKYDVYDPAFVRELNRKRNTQTYKECIASGGVSYWYEDDKEEAFIPLHKMTSRHFRQALDQRYAEHKAAAVVQKQVSDGVHYQSALLPLGDAQGTIWALMKAGATDNDLRALMDALVARYSAVPVLLGSASVNDHRPDIVQ